MGIPADESHFQRLMAEPLPPRKCGHRPGVTRWCPDCEYDSAKDPFNLAPPIEPVQDE